MTITKRSDKGSALTYQELDANFTHVEELLPTFAGVVSSSGAWTGSTGITASKTATGTYDLTFSSAFSNTADYHVQANVQDGGDLKTVSITRATDKVTLTVHTGSAVAISGTTTTADGDSGDGIHSHNVGTLSGSTTRSLSDSAISVIVYDNTTTGGGGGAAITNLTSLSDVTINSPQTGQVLQYNGSFFVNATSSVSNAFTGLSDTPASLGTARQFLAVNSSGNALEFVTNQISGMILADDQKASAGTGDDLLIFHESSSNNSIIREVNSSGGLLLQSSSLKLQNADGTEDYLIATANDSVAIKHDNVTRLETTSVGVNVTGRVEFDSLKGTGAVSITDIKDEDNMASDSATSLATQQSIKKYVDDQIVEGVVVEGTANEIDVSVNAGTFTVGLPNNVTLGGALTVAGNIIPTTDVTYDLGSTTKRFKDIFLSGSTIDLGGTLISKDVSGNIEFKDDQGSAKSLTSVSTITASGSITGTSFVIGSAEISEAELETIDGVTAGTVSASKAVVVDADKDITGFRNVTIAGNLTVSGTTTTVATTNTVVSDRLLELGNGTTGTPANDMGIVLERGDSANAFMGFDESADKFIVGTGTFTGASTGDLSITTGTLVANLEGAVTGNASTASALASAVNIGGVSFDGSANIDLPGVNASGSQDTSGTAAKVTVTDSTASTDFPVVFNNESDGLLDDTGTFIYNPSTGLVSATGFSGNLTGTLQTASQTNITAVGTIGTGTWQGTAIANDYIGNHSAAKLTSGTIDNARLPSAATSITSVGTLSNLIIQPPVGSTGGILVNSEGGSASFLLAGVGSVGDADYVAPGTFYVSGAANAVISSAAIALVGPTSVSGGALTVNNNLFEIVSTDDDVNADPIISLYRNRANPAAGDLIGEIQFNGEDSASNKTLYAAIAARASDETNPNEEDGQLFTYLAKQGVKTHITSVFNYGIVHQPGIHQYLTGTGKLQMAAGNSGGFYNALYSVTPTANRSVLLPDANGTIVLKDSTDTLTNKSIDAGQLTGTIDDARIPSGIARDSELSSFITASSTDTLTNKSIVATQLTGTIDNARLPAAATNITSVGNLSALTIAMPAGTTGNFLPVKLGSGSGIDAITDSASSYNYAIGLDVLENLTSGTSNIGIGRRALEDCTSGLRNVVIGHISGGNLTTASDNVFIGYANGEQGVVTGSNNVGVGSLCFRSLTSGVHNIALGKQALDHTTTGSYNIALGLQAMDGNGTAITGASDNIAIGRYSLFNNTTGDHNTALGYQALYKIDTGGGHNIGVGYQCGYNVTTGDYNYLLGYRSGGSTTTSSHQISIGYESGGGEDGVNNPGRNQSSGISFGYKAAGKNTAPHNIAIGYAAMRLMSDSNAYYNIAIGREAMGTAEKLQHCIAMGYRALYDNKHEEDIVAIGELAMNQAGYAITIDATSSSIVDVTNNRFTISSADFGYLNHRVSGFHDNTRLQYYNNGGTSIGGLTNGGLYYVTNDSTASALYLATSSNKTSSNAVAISAVGVGAGHYFVIQSSQSVALGNNSFRYGRQIMNSLAIGANAARGVNGVTSQNGSTHVGYAAGYSSQKSRFSTNVGYLAGYSAQSSYMRTSVGARAGVYDRSSYSTAFGAYSLSSNSSTFQTGNHNVAVGYASMNKNTSAPYNCAVGSYSMYDNTTGSRNTAIGYNALPNNTSGSYNTALGLQAMGDNTTGGYNTCVGAYAGDELVSGTQNTALGYGSMQFKHGKLNIAVGYGAMNGTSSGSGDSPYGNIAFGVNTLQDITSGATGNIAQGVNAGRNITTGDYNTCIAQSTGATITTGQHNICIGVESDVSAAGAVHQYNIGYRAECDQNYQITIGNSTVGVIRNEYDTDATWTQSSDLRKKTNINDMALGLDFIDKLKPITYQWKPNNELPEEFKEYAEENVKDTETVMTGLGAQDVKQALDDVGYTERFPGWKEEEDGSQRISKEEFIIPLINAIQELKAEVEMLKEKLNNGNN